MVTELEQRVISDEKKIDKLEKRLAELEQPPQKENAQRKIFATRGLRFHPNNPLPKLEQKELNQ